MKIVRLTALLPDMPRLSAPKPNLRHGGDMLISLSLSLSLLNQSILCSVRSLVLLPLPAFPTVLLPGSHHRSKPTTGDPTFLLPSQNPCGEKPEATYPSSNGPDGLKSLSSAAFSMLNTWPFGPPPLWSLLLRRLHCKV